MEASSPSLSGQVLIRSVVFARRVSKIWSCSCKPLAPDGDGEFIEPPDADEADLTIVNLSIPSRSGLLVVSIFGVLEGL